GLFRYGAWVGAGVSIIFLSQNADVFIGGRIIHRASDIGFYTTCWSLAFIGAGIFATVTTSIVFPTLSRLQDDRRRLTEKLLGAFRLLAFVTLPGAALLASLAPVMIVPLLGEKFAPYRSSFLVLSILAVYAGNRTLLWIFFEGYKSVGRPWLVPAYNAVKLAIIVPTMIWGAQHGIIGLAVAYLPIQAIEIPAAVLLASRVLDFSPGQVWRAARAPIITAGLTAGSAIALELVFLGVLHAGDLATLAVSASVGVLAYLGAVLAVDRDAIQEARTLLVRGL
ncbi:MAG TPA: oligosaccharide flippase family protein, partial [Chloroflexota bacterium]